MVIGTTPRLVRVWIRLMVLRSIWIAIVELVLGRRMYEACWVSRLVVVLLWWIVCWVVGRIGVVRIDGCSSWRGWEVICLREEARIVGMSSGRPWAIVRTVATSRVRRIFLA